MATMKKFVISLSRTPERLETFKRLNSHLSNYSRYPAIDGTVTDKSYYPLRLAPDLRYSPGAVGCALSHIGLWEECERMGKPITILEDDAVCHRGFEGISQQLIQKLPSDWDMVVWGWNFDCPVQYEALPGVSTCHAAFSYDNLAKNLSKYQDLSISAALFRLRCSFGTPGYAISPSGAAKLRQMLLPIRNFSVNSLFFSAENSGIDVALISMYQKINAYVSFPPLLLTLNEHSTSTIRKNL